MPNSKLTVLQILKQVSSFYIKNPQARAVEANSCLYWTVDGRSCAVGRCLLPSVVYKGELPRSGTPEGMVHPKAGAVDGLCGGVMDGKAVNKVLDRKLRKRYRGHVLQFWRDLQSFHDSSSYWNANGITEYGKERLAFLLQKYVDQ